MTRTLEVGDEDLQTINDALMQMPYYRAAPLIHKINEQLRAQPNEAAIGRTDTPQEGLGQDPP
jgi:hypothetical protein